MILRMVVWGGVVLLAIVVAVVVTGYLLPKEHVASRDAVVSSTQGEVFAVIADVARHAEWRKDVTAVEVLSSAPLRWKERGRNGEITYEVREQRPPDRLVVAIADPTLPFGGTWTYELSPAADGTRVAITEHGEVRNPVFRFMSRFVFSQTATMEMFLASLGDRMKRTSASR